METIKKNHLANGTLCTDAESNQMFVNRMSQAGKEQIIKAHKIIIVDAISYFATQGIFQRYKGLYVAITLDTINSRFQAIQGRDRDWLFDNVKNAIRAIRRLNKTGQIITMNSDEFLTFIEADKHKDLKTRYTESKIERSQTMLHVVYENDVFNVGFYDREQVNKQADLFIKNEEPPQPIYKTIFRPIQQYPFLEQAEQHAAHENLLFALRHHDIEQLKNFLQEQNRIDFVEMLQFRNKLE